MGKKIPLLISTLTAISVGSGLLSSAAFATSSGASKNYWTVAELLAAKPIIDSTKDDFCGNNWDCREGVSQAYRGLGNRAGGEVELESIRVAVTSVNPSNGTVKIAYFGESLEHRTWTAKRFNLTELYAFWIDADQSSQIPQATWTNIRNDVEVPGTHILISKNLANSSSGWFPEGQEVTFTVGDISNIPRNELYVYANSEDGINTYGPTNFSSCINSPNYQEGMECRLVYSNDIKWFEFIPMIPAEADYVDYDASDLEAIPRMITIINNIVNNIEPTIVQVVDGPAESNSDPAVSDSPNDADITNNSDTSNYDTATSPSQDAESNSDATTPAGDSAPNSANDESSSPVEVIAQTTTSSAPSPTKAPETGTLKEQSYAEFLWWLVPILSAGIAATVWFLWPTRRK